MRHRRASQRRLIFQHICLIQETEKLRRNQENRKEKSRKTRKKKSKKNQEKIKKERKALSWNYKKEDQKTQRADWKKKFAPMIC